MEVPRFHFRMNRLLLIAFALCVSFSALAQTVTDSSYRIVAHIKPDGTIQDSSYRTLGYIRKDGSVQDASYRIIGHADGIPLAWAAFYFFFSE